MVRFLLVCVIAVLHQSVCDARGDSNAPYGTAGDFEEYVLALSCPQTFCRANPNKANTDECDNPRYIYLILHGLWPNYNPKRGAHGWPQFCKTQFGELSNSELLQQLESVVPDWRDIAPEYDELIGHEWSRHGTCSGLSPQAYFKLAFDSAREHVNENSQCSGDKELTLPNNPPSTPADGGSESEGGSDGGSESDSEEGGAGPEVEEEAEKPMHRSTSSHASSDSDAPFGHAGDFDEYVLALSCPSSFCRSNPSKKSTNECKDPRFTYLILHGLWPNYNVKRDGHGWPQFCQSKFGSQSKAKLLSTLASVAPDWEELAPEYDELIDHEWSRHGTCSGLSPSEYLKLAFDTARTHINQDDLCRHDQSLMIAKPRTRKT